MSAIAHCLRNAQHEQFALYVAVLVMSYGEAYAAVYGQEDRDVANNCGSRLMGNAEIALRVEQLRKVTSASMVSQGLLSLQEVRQGLADIWRTSLGSLIDEDGLFDMDLVRKLPAWVLQEVEVVEKTVTRGSGDDVYTVTTKRCRVKLADKLSAAKFDSELAGDLPPPSMTDMLPHEKVSRRKKALALLARLPGHGGHLVESLEVPGEVVS